MDYGRPMKSLFNDIPTRQIGRIHYFVVYSVLLVELIGTILAQFLLQKLCFSDLIQNKVGTSILWRLKIYWKYLNTWNNDERIQIFDVVQVSLLILCVITLSYHTLLPETSFFLFIHQTCSCPLERYFGTKRSVKEIPHFRE